MSAKSEKRYETSRTLKVIEHDDLLGDCLYEIFEYLRHNPSARVLDIGCGNGAALSDLKKDFPEATCDGIDSNPQTPKKGIRIAHKPAEDLAIKNRYDIIFSTAVLPYVKDKRKALQNIARALALESDAKAYIHCDPFYFGPHGDQIFEGSDIAKWRTNSAGKLSVIEIRGGGTPDQVNNLMADWTAYKYPNELKVEQYDDPKNPRGQQKPQIPLCFSPKKIKELKYGLGKQIGTVINWDLMSFVDVATYNKGISEGRIRDYHPFMYAAMESIYFRETSLTREQLISQLINVRNWSPILVDPNWQAGPGYRYMVGELRKQLPGIEQPAYAATRTSLTSLFSSIVGSASSALSRTSAAAPPATRAPSSRAHSSGGFMVAGSAREVLIEMGKPGSGRMALINSNTLLKDFPDDEDFLDGEVYSDDEGLNAGAPFSACGDFNHGAAAPAPRGRIKKLPDDADEVVQATDATQAVKAPAAPETQLAAEVEVAASPLVGESLRRRVGFQYADEPGAGSTQRREEQPDDVAAERPKNCCEKLREVCSVM